MCSRGRLQGARDCRSQARLAGGVGSGPRLSGPFVARSRKLRAWWLLAGGIRRPRRWWHPQTWPSTVLLWVLSAFFLACVVLGFLPKALATPVTGGVKQALADLGMSSAAVFAALWFLAWRFRRARRLYLRKAREDAVGLVKPGSIIGEVVGRDQLCDALMSDLRDRKRRRPHVIVGSIGLGKTAVLVRLTELLARKGAVPVVLRLQDLKAGDELDFTVLAREHFLEAVREWVSPSEAEKVWQRLRYRNDSIVVLADGLEEALSGAPDRANKIRKAIADADDAKLALVMASRPQESLQAMRAANTVLEPLGEEPALRYIAENSGWRSDKRLLDWVVEAANVAESPLYLNIAKDLEARGRLEPVVGGCGDELADPRDQDEWVLRYDLLDAWINALIGGALYPEQPLAYESRLRAVQDLVRQDDDARWSAENRALAPDAMRRHSRVIRPVRSVTLRWRQPGVRRNPQGSATASYDMTRSALQEGTGRSACGCTSAVPAAEHSIENAQRCLLGPRPGTCSTTYAA